MTDPKAHGLLFTAPMILAALDGRKTQTRRVVTPHNSLIDGSGEGVRAHWKHLDWSKAEADDGCFVIGMHKITPRYQVGDLVWGKETWAAVDYMVDGVEREDPTVVAYLADRAVLRHDLTSPVAVDTSCWNWKHKSIRWRSSLYMPRWASRFERPIVRVGAERVQEISLSDCVSEGVGEMVGGGHFRGDEDSRPYEPDGLFHDLWNSINGNKPGRDWESNPPVWPIEWGTE